MKRLTLMTVIALLLAFTAPVDADALDLTGTYSANDGGIYYVQQTGDVLWWAGMSLDRGLPADFVWHRGLHFTNVFRGTIRSSDNTVVGEWADVSRGLTLNSGTLTLQIGSSGGVPQLTKLTGTGGFGAATWTRTDSLDDMKFNGSTLDIFSRFDAVHKNNADLTCFEVCGSNSTLHDNLKPYRDATVVYGRLVNTHVNYLASNRPVESEIPHVNYGPDSAIPDYPDFGHLARDFKSFACYDHADADLDIRLKIDLDRLEPDFYTTGWGNRTSGPTVFHLKLDDATTRQKLRYAANEAYMGAETIMLGKAGTCDELMDPTFGFASLLPGWADLWSASVLVNGRPINGNLPSPQPTDVCDFIQPCPFIPDGVDSSNYLVRPAGIRFGDLLLSAFGDGKVPPGDGDGTYVRVTGTLVLDCGHGLTHDCFDDTDDPDDIASRQNQEIHPVYSIDVINYPFRPEDLTVPARMNLTGTWGGSDGSTYYVRQIGNTIWWLSLMRDRQPIQRGTDFPVIGALQLGPAFDAGDPPCSSSPHQCWAFATVFKGTITRTPIETVIEGDWAGVPQSTGAGSSGGHAKFFVTFNKILVPAAPGIFPVITEKLYEPEDTTPPESTLTIGTPRYPAGASQPFVTSATSFTIAATDVGSGVQNIWDRVFAKGATPPAYTSVFGASTSFALTGPDGWYEVDSFATDNAGNDETPSHSQLAYLDNTPPQITIGQPIATTYPHSAILTLDYSVNDGPGSGVQGVTPRMDAATTLKDGTGLANGQAINLLTQMSLGTHTFSIDAVDNLSNAGTKSVTFTIIVTADSIKGDVDQFLGSGAIKNAGEANSLLAKLDTAAAARARGNCGAAGNAYQAFINELQAQSGKGVDPTAAAVMIADAQYLIAHCP